MQRARSGTGLLFEVPSGDGTVGVQDLRRWGCEMKLRGSQGPVDTTSILIIVQWWYRSTQSPAGRVSCHQISGALFVYNPDSLLICFKYICLNITWVNKHFQDVIRSLKFRSYLVTSFPPSSIGGCLHFLEVLIFLPKQSILILPGNNTMFWTDD